MTFMQYGSKGIDFKLKIDENIPMSMIGDELRIKQVLNNLLSNSFKYTKKGEVLLSFTAESIAGDENRIMLEICVRDTGQGMTEEQVQKLFDDYSRFNLEANRTTVGTGLGMAMTSSLVNLMGGHITVESTPGKGTAVFVNIPQEKLGSGVLGREAVENLEQFRFSQATQERKAKIVREPMPYGSVLVVDDMKSNLDVAKLLLAPYQLHVYTAESGIEAFMIVKSGLKFDIIFMDHMMPEMDGIETVQKIRGIDYREPIVALTANAVSGQQERFLANGFDGYISKPIDMRQLNNILNKLIRDKYREKGEISPDSPGFSGP
jgi:CheY-like chemotaxis protein/anti-sigma regulatory factor (Ser/Thr protein kinase)